MKKKSKTWVGVTAVAIVSILMACGPQVVSAQSLEELLALANKIQNQNPGINFQLASDKKDYKVGESIVFEFKADRDCYLALIDIGTSGKTKILFPNRYHPENKIEKDKVYAIPAVGADFKYEAEGPGGLETIKAVASLNPVLVNVQSLQEELKQPLQKKRESLQGEVFLTMKDPGLVLKDVGIALTGVKSEEWATVDLKFNILDKGTTPPASAPSPESTPPSTSPAPTEQK